MGGYQAAILDDRHLPVADQYVRQVSDKLPHSQVVLLVCKLRHVANTGEVIREENLWVIFLQLRWGVHEVNITRA